MVTKGISIKKTGNELYEIYSYKQIPQIIYDYIFENYNPVFGDNNYIKFYEFNHIGVEIRLDTLKQNNKIKSYEHF